MVEDVGGEPPSVLIITKEDTSPFRKWPGWVSVVGLRECISQYHSVFG